MASPLPTPVLDLLGPLFTYTDLASTLKGLNARLARGADVNALNPILGKLPLCEVRSAAEGQGEPVVRWFLDHGANPRAQDRLCNTPLHHYLYYGLDDPMVDALMEAHPDLSHRNVAGHSVLDVAVLQNRTFWVERLIKAGANVNAQHPVSGDTALHHAMRYGLDHHKPLVSMLLMHGADPENVNVAGLTPSQACGRQPCPWWPEVLIIRERRILRDTVAAMSMPSTGPLGTSLGKEREEGGRPVRRERPRLLIGG